MDPFEKSIEKPCIPINPDNIQLQNCPFTYDCENTSPESSLNVTPESQPTGIFMLSLPSTTDSFTQYSPNEHFETPPEQNNSSQPYFSGSDDPKPSDTDAVNQESNNSNTLVAIDLANDSDELGCEGQVGKNVRVSQEGLDEKERVVIEISQTQEVDTEVVVVEEFEENLEADEDGVERNEDDKMYESGGEEGDGGEERGDGDDDKFKDVVVDDGASGGNDKLNAGCVQSEGVTEGVGGGEGRRELPASMRGGERRNVGLTEEVGSSKNVMTGSFKDLMEAVSKVIGNASRADKSGDFFETAQRRGMILPRPRWWPPEGFGD